MQLDGICWRDLVLPTSAIVEMFGSVREQHTLFTLSTSMTLTSRVPTTPKRTVLVAANCRTVRGVGISGMFTL